MPLPNYGHDNKEKKTHQDMVFEMAPEIVSDEEEVEIINGKKVKRKRGKVTTGKLGIDLERTLVIHEEKDPSIWHTEVDPKDIEEAKKFSAPERKTLKADVRKGIDSLISGAKARTVRGARRPSLADSPPPSAETQKNLRFNLPESNKQTEQSITGVSIQPSGTYPLGRSVSSSPRSTPDPQEQSLGRRLDSRYQTETPVRHSLTQAYHEKTNKKIPNGDAYTMSQVTVQKSFKSQASRGIN